jgi:DNA-3-methyladenine glycosylase I
MDQTTDRIRCAWANSSDELLRAYHDTEWGVPIRDERHLFELLVLEGAQAGLSWNTILRKRDGYRAAFASFEPAAVAAFTDADVERLMADAGIVRNRAKIQAAIDDARATLILHAAGSSLVDYLWSFVGGVPRSNRIEGPGEVPSETDESRAMSKDLRARGFRFVGPTICYALMQSAGLVNDHQLDCFRRTEVMAPA